MLTKDTAICIRAVDYSETSQVVTFFSRATGKISAIAKGAKRPRSAFDGPIEMFSHGEIVFSDSTKEKLAVLTEFEQQPGFTGLANKLFALNCASFAAELVNQLTNEHDPHPGLFDSFLQFLQNINEQSAANKGPRDTLALLILFQLALLKEIGLQPILNACANCKNRYTIRDTKYASRDTRDEAGWPEVYFSHSANGLVCRDCQDSFPGRIRLTAQAANALSNLRLLADVNEKTLNEIEKVLVYHLTELIGRRPKMAKYILKN